MSCRRHLVELAGQMGYVVGTLLHPGSDIFHLLGLQRLVTLLEQLGKAANDVKRGTYPVIHILDESHLLLVSLQLQLIGLGKLIVLFLQLIVVLANRIYALSQRLLHADKAVGEPSHTILAMTLRQRLIKSSLSYVLGLLIEPAVLSILSAKFSSACMVVSILSCRRKSLEKLTNKKTTTPDVTNTKAATISDNWVEKEVCIFFLSKVIVIDVFVANISIFFKSACFLPTFFY